jgi:hypothetical protein
MAPISIAWDWKLLTPINTKFKTKNGHVDKDIMKCWRNSNTVEPLITDTLINEHLQ